ncbi:MAG: FAD-dependent thymidylate synthase [Candidatus Dojkabacteria bacterium]
MEEITNLEQLRLNILQSLPKGFELIEPNETSGPIKIKDTEKGKIYLVSVRAYVNETGENLAPLELTNEETGEKYELTATSPDETGIRIFKLKNLSTGTEINHEINYFEFNKKISVANFVAWVGSRTSRSPDKYADIAKQILDDNVDTGKKLTNFFVKYGHASVAGMAIIAMGIDNVSIFTALDMFNDESIGDGQEYSTRYGEIIFVVPSLEYSEDLGLTPEQVDEINSLVTEIQTFEEDNFKKWKERVLAVHSKFAEDNAEVIAEYNRFQGTKIKVDDNLLLARTFDVIRQLIPMGAKTKFFLVGSVRVWKDMITQLHESPYTEQNNIAKDIDMMLKIGSNKEVKEKLAPQMVDAGLLSYSEGKFTIEEALEKLKTYLNEVPGFDAVLNSRELEPKLAVKNKVSLIKDLGDDSVAFEYILTLYPNIDLLELKSFLHLLPVHYKEKIGDIIFESHDHHNLMHTIGDVRSHKIWIIEGAMSALRDLNRHRAWARFMAILETKDIDAILDDGFNDNFQMNNAEYLKEFRAEWNEDFIELYRKIRALNNKLKEMGASDEVRRNLIIKVLPLGHQTTLMMSGPDTQAAYMIARRTTDGADFAYANMVEELNKLNKASNPYMRNFLGNRRMPDPNNPISFASRT